MIRDPSIFAAIDMAKIASPLLLGVLLYIFRRWVTKILEHTFGAVFGRLHKGYRYRRYVREYARLMLERHETLHVVGLRTELEKRRPVAEAYVEQFCKPLDQSAHAVPAVERLAEPPRFTVVLGAPGAGKSTLLTHLVISAATALRERSRTWFRRRKMSPLSVLPIYVPLGQCSAKNDDLLKDILDSRTAILSLAQIHNMPSGFLEYFLARGSAVALLDGIDEVDDPSARNSLYGKVNDFLERFPRAKVIVTCRTAGWRGGFLRDPQVLELAPLTPIQQVDLIYKWYRAGMRIPSGITDSKCDEVKREVEREAGDLVTTIEQTESIRELARNPLLLSLICLVHRQKGHLPVVRAALYTECVEVLLVRWDEIKGRAQNYIAGDSMKGLLQRIAYRMHIEGRRQIARSDLERLVGHVYPQLLQLTNARQLVLEIERRGGIMTERSVDQLMFAHQTLQEHFLADYLLTMALDDDTIRSLSTADWREPFRLMCGRHRNPLRLISAVCRESPILALSALADVDPVHLETPDAQEFVAGVLVRADLFRTSECVEAVVTLLRVRSNPFGALVEKFVERAITQGGDCRLHVIVDALGNICTAASAGVLIKLLVVASCASARPHINATLARLQDVALREVLESERAKVLSGQQVFDFLTECTCLAATRQLWERYGLHPGPGREEKWAQAWAHRLADGAVDRVFKAIKLKHGPVPDRSVWPYDKNADTAAAWLIYRCVEILSERYRDRSELYIQESGTIDRCAIRVLIPMAIRGVPDELVYRRYLAMLRRHREIRLANGLESGAVEENGVTEGSDALPAENEETGSIQKAESLTKLFSQLPDLQSGVGGWLRLGSYFAHQRSDRKRMAADVAAYAAAALLLVLFVISLPRVAERMMTAGTWVYQAVESLPAWAIGFSVVTPVILLGTILRRCVEDLILSVVVVALVLALAFASHALFFLLLISRPGILLVEAAISGTTINGVMLGQRVWRWRAAAVSLTAASAVYSARSASDAIQTHWPGAPFTMLSIGLTVLSIAATGIWIWARVFRVRDDWIVWLASHPKREEILREFGPSAESWKVKPQLQPILHMYE